MKNSVTFNLNVNEDNSNEFLLYSKQVKRDEIELYKMVFSSVSKFLEQINDVKISYDFR